MDVEYLRANSRVVEAFMLVDTSQRDKRAWQSPSEFTVEFEEPYTNVVSVAVVDATIPVTVYAVDTHNNGFRFFCQTGGYLGAGAAGEALTRCERLSTAGRMLGAAPARGGCSTSVMRLYWGPPPPGSAPLGPSSGDPWALGVHLSSAAVQEASAGASANIDGGRLVPHALAADGRSVEPGPGRRSLYKGGDGVVRACLSVGGGPAAPLSAPYALWDEGDAGQEFCPLGAAYELARAPDGPGWLLRGATETDDSAPGAAGYGLELTFVECRLEPGDYDAPGLFAAFEHAVPVDPASGAGMVEMVSRSSAFPKGSAEFMQYSRSIGFQSARPFWLDMSSSTLSDVLGFSELPARGAPVLPLALNARVFASVPAPLGSAASWELASPGALNLNGTRHVILRCPQVEDATPSISRKACTPGIGVFKLYDQTKLAHLRFDYSIGKVDFHPIGKLPRLHLRFERLGGALYDFKGVDFHVTIVVRMLHPQRPNFAARAAVEGPGPEGVRHLNPDYDPDVLRYLVRTREELDEFERPPDADLLGDAAHGRRFERARHAMARRAAACLARPPSGGDGGSSDSGWSD